MLGGCFIVLEYDFVLLIIRSIGSPTHTTILTNTSPVDRCDVYVFPSGFYERELGYFKFS